MDSTASYRRQGRQRQGASSPLWGPTEWSESLQRALCPMCFKREFAQAAIRENQARAALREAAS